MADVGPWALVEGLGFPAAVVGMLMWVIGKYLIGIKTDVTELKAVGCKRDDRVGDLLTSMNGLCQRMDKFIEVWASEKRGRS